MCINQCSHNYFAMFANIAIKITVIFVILDILVRCYDMLALQFNEK